MSQWLWRAVFALISAGFWAGAGAAQDWRPLDPQNTLIVDTTKGRIVVVQQF